MARSIPRQVREQLRDAILSGQLKPGDRLLEADLARQFGVSITPVREALRGLESARLVVSQPHRGTVVRQLTRQDIHEMYSLRAHLDRLAIRLALPRLTGEDFEYLERLVDQMVAFAEESNSEGMVDVDVSFHDHLYSRGGHRLLHETWASINPSNWTMLSVRVLAGRGPLYIAERHRPLLAALREGGIAQAEESMSAHISELGEQVLAEWPAD